jgi:CRISP-associated protein Cas1
MLLYLDSFGASLRVKNSMFWVVSANDTAVTFAPTEIKSILLTKGIVVTTDAFLLAIRHNIPVILLDSIGHPVGQVWSGQYGSISTIRQQQAVWSRTVAAFIWAKNELIIPKLQAQLQHLEQLPILVPHSITVISKTLAQINDLKTDTTEGLADTLRGYEGIASRYYFAALSKNLPVALQFKTRSAHPAADAFNAALNYAYGILYAQVEIALLQSGIDPAISVLHIPRHTRPTFVYDCIEPYRAWADAVIMQLFCTDIINETHFDEWQHPTTLATSIRASAFAKQQIVQHLLAHLATVITYKNITRKRGTHLNLDAARLATLLMDSD